MEVVLDPDEVMQGLLCELGRHSAVQVVFEGIDVLGVVLGVEELLKEIGVPESSASSCWNISARKAGNAWP